MRAAIVFLTRIPVGSFAYRATDFVWAPAHFPLVGGLLGALLGATYLALLPLGGLAAATLTLAVSLLLTGAFHEDGLADTSDALGGAYDREKILLILKDSRVGTFGAAAVVVSILGRAVLVAPMGTRAFAAFVLVGSVARAAPVWLMAILPYATGTADTAKSGDVRRAGVSQAVVATAWAAAIAGGLVAQGAVPLSRALAVAGVCVVVGVVTGVRFARRLGGITGDFLGASEQLCELAGFAALAWGFAPST